MLEKLLITDECGPTQKSLFCLEDSIQKQLHDALRSEVSYRKIVAEGSLDTTDSSSNAGKNEGP